MQRLSKLARKPIKKNASYEAPQKQREKDKVLKEERAHMDSAISKERSQKKSMQKYYFSEERGATNTHLAEERDITDKETTRQQRLLTDEQHLHFIANEALTTRDEFLAIVTHDLRNPIGAVLSSADLLIEEIDHLEKLKAKNYWS